MGRSKLVLDPSARFDSPSWDGWQYRIRLREGSAGIESGADAPLEVLLPEETVLHVNANSNVAVNLSNSQVVCVRGSAYLSRSGTTQELQPGASITLAALP
jgi:ferric-dicitrate binding protein FerR (iron transport regulator)